MLGARLSTPPLFLVVELCCNSLDLLLGLDPCHCEGHTMTPEATTTTLDPTATSSSGSAVLTAAATAAPLQPLLPLACVLELASGVASGLAAVHAAGFTHGGWTPARCCWMRGAASSWPTAASLGECWAVCSWAACSWPLMFATVSKL